MGPALGAQVPFDKRSDAGLGDGERSVSHGNCPGSAGEAEIRAYLKVHGRVSARTGAAAGNSDPTGVADCRPGADRCDGEGTPTAVPGALCRSRI